MRFFIILLFSSIAFANLTMQDIERIKYRVKMLESKGKGDLYAQNSLGYLGRYQFGAAALVMVGLIKKDRYEKATYIDKKIGARRFKKGITNKSFLNNPKNWNLSKGKNSFLGNEILQENAMNELIYQHFRQLQRLNLNLSKDETVGFLVASHLGGFNSALRYLKDRVNFKDANGTPISKYYKIGALKLSKKEQQIIEKTTKKYLGIKYRWGGVTPKGGFDCSGYTQFVYKKIGINLPRTALLQSKVGIKVGIDQLKKGDLLFFLTDKSRNIPITHVGIYLGNGKFIHSASKKQGVIISKLKKYRNRFVLAKRVLKGKVNFKIAIDNQPIEVRANLAPTKVAFRPSFKYRLVGNKYIKD